MDKGNSRQAEACGCWFSRLTTIPTLGFERTPVVRDGTVTPAEFIQR